VSETKEIEKQTNIVTVNGNTKVKLGKKHAKQSTHTRGRNDKPNSSLHLAPTIAPH